MTQEAPTITERYLVASSTSRLRLMVICSSGSGCSTGSVRAASTLRDAVIELRDD